jgi:sec-independent protein translocase protein TatB
MGGLGPGIGGLEYLVIAAVALIVVGPERLPGMLRQLGKWVAKMRGMANEFRSSFDEMARQSELDDLRKEVEALRTGQGAVGQGMVRLGDEANAAFKDIKSDLQRIDAGETAAAAVTLNQPEFPDPVMAPLAPPAAPATVRRPRAKTLAKPAAEAPAKVPATKPDKPKVTRPKATAEKVKAARPRAPRKPRATA